MNSHTSHADDEFTVGDSREQTVIAEVTRTQIVQFAGVSGDYSHLHTDEPRALRAGYPSVMAHGMLAMGAAERLLADWVGRERLTRYRVRFVSPVWPGDSLHAVATVLDVRDKQYRLLVDVLLVTHVEYGRDRVRRVAGPHRAGRSKPGSAWAGPGPTQSARSRSAAPIASIPSAMLALGVAGA